MPKLMFHMMKSQNLVAEAVPRKTVRLAVRDLPGLPGIRLLSFVVALIPNRQVGISPTLLREGPPQGAGHIVSPMA